MAASPCSYKWLNQEEIRLFKALGQGWGLILLFNPCIWHCNRPGADTQEMQVD